MGVMPKTPSVTVQVDSVFVDPGETITVWLGNTAERQQVELRCLPNGKCEVYCGPEVALKSFAHWTVMEAPDAD
jgi:hypothetical protein